MQVITRRTFLFFWVSSALTCQKQTSSFCEGVNGAAFGIAGNSLVKSLSQCVSTGNGQKVWSAPSPRGWPQLSLHGWHWHKCHWWWLARRFLWKAIVLGISTGGRKQWWMRTFLWQEGRKVQERPGHYVCEAPRCATACAVCRVLGFEPERYVQGKTRKVWGFSS